MDHLGIKEFLVMGFCIGGPIIWNLQKRASERIVAAVHAQPSGFLPEMPTLFYDNNMTRWGPPLAEKRPDVTIETVDKFLTSMYKSNPDFVFTVTRDFVRMPDADPGPAGRRAGAPVRRGDGGGEPRAELRGQHLPLEGEHGAGHGGGAPRPQLPEGAHPVMAGR